MLPTLCCWNFTPERMQALRRICGGMRVRLRPVSAAEAGVPLARLPQTDPLPSPAAMPFGDEMLLMAAFTGAQVDNLLAGLRREGLAPVRLKAVLSPFNAGWDSLTLRRSLAEEAARMP